MKSETLHNVKPVELSLCLSEAPHHEYLRCCGGISLRILSLDARER